MYVYVHSINLFVNKTYYYLVSIRRRQWQPTPVFLPRESLGQRSLLGSHRVGHDWSDSACVHALSCHDIATAWYFIYFWLRWVFVAACGLFSSCGEQRLLSNCSVWASHCSDFSCGARALEHRLSSCGAWALVTPCHVESFQTRNWTHVLCIGRQILYCQAIREVMLANLFQESSGTWLVMLAYQSVLWGLDSSFSSWIWGDFLE